MRLIRDESLGFELVYVTIGCALMGYCSRQMKVYSRLMLFSRLLSNVKLRTIQALTMTGVHIQVEVVLR